MSKRSFKKFEKYYDEHVGPVYRYVVLRVSNKEEAEDLVSEIFLKALEHFDDFDETRPFNHWIFTIAQNHLFTHYRRKKPTVALDDIVELQTPSNLEEEIGLKDSFDRIKEGMSELDKEKRIMIEMKYLLGYSYKEIGDYFGKNEEAAKVATFRAIQELKAKFPEMQ